MKKTLLFLLVLLVGLTTRAESLTPNETFTIEREVGLGYSDQSIDVDFTAACTYLGISSVSEATAVGINMSDGTIISNAMDQYDGWRNKSGDFVSWGSEASVCVKFKPTESAKLYGICDIYSDYPDNVPTAGETFTCQWGLQANSKTYVYQVEVKFVETLEYTFEIAKTITVNVDVIEKTSFNGQTATFDVSEVTSALGANSIADCSSYIERLSDGKFVSNTTDGWRNAAGDPTAWTSLDEGSVCVKLNASEGLLWDIMCYDTSHSAGDTYTAKWGIVYNNKAVVLEVVLNFITEPAYTFEIVKTITVNVNETEKTDYSGQTATFTVSDVTDALGVSSIADCSQYIVKVSDGTFVTNSTSGWRDANGDPASWNSYPVGGVCVQIADASSGTISYIGCFDQTHVAGETYTAKCAFVYNEKAVVLDVVLTFVPASTPYVTFTEKGANSQKTYYYATYETVYPMNLDKCDFEAYTVNEAGSVLSYDRVTGTVPANTPLLVRATSTGDKEAVLGKVADAVTPENNSLLASDGNITGDGSTIYVLGNIDGTLGWYWKTSGVAIADGKCYLQSSAGVKFIGLDDAATGISSITTNPVASPAARYSLAGQRVNASYKGIVIENGKKYLIK